MYFGTYLIENNLISHESYIQALIIQQNSIPSTLECLIELNLEDNETVVELIKKSQIENISLVSCVRKELVEKIEAHKIKSTKSIAEALYDISAISVADLKKASEEFKKLESQSVDEPLEEKVNESVGEKAPEVISAAALESLKELQGDDFDPSLFTVEETSVSESKKDSSEEVEISSAALESLKELQGSDFNASEFNAEEKSQSCEESLVEQLTTQASKKDKSDLSQIYNINKQKKVLKIEGMIKKAIETDQEVSNYLNSLYRELHIIKGAAALSGAQRLCKIIDIWEVCINLLFKKEESFVKKWAVEYISTLRETMDTAWMIREELESANSEDDVFKNNDIKEAYMSCISQLKPSLSAIKEG